jgi:hypothetical protein
VRSREAARSRRAGSSRGSTSSFRRTSRTAAIGRPARSWASWSPPRAEKPLVRIDSVRAVAGRGLEGDRYFDGRGTFSGTGRGYELTLVEEQALADVDLIWEDARRNVVTRGIALNTLVGRYFTVGTAECIGRRLAEPCAHLEKLSRPGIIRPLVHRAGLRADILRDGEIALGDAVVPR